jgi:hypothetical protein
LPLPHNGRRHRLILYTYMVDRWWRLMLWTGVILLALVAALTWVPGRIAGFTPMPIEQRYLWLAAVVGGLAVFLAFFLLAIRKSAYVQPFNTHLRLITPFLRMNISYRRIRQASSAEMGRLFPPENFKGWKRGFLRPLAKKTVILLDMNGWPLPRWALAFFLSPFFFPDKTASMALFVPDWVRFSNEMESFRSAWLDSLHPLDNNPRANLLESLSKK